VRDVRAVSKQTRPPKRFTEAHLREIQQLITAERMDIRTHNVCRVTMTGVDVHENKVSVGIDPYEQSFAAELLCVYGADRITVEHHSPISYLGHPTS